MQVVASSDPIILTLLSCGVTAAISLWLTYKRPTGPTVFVGINSKWLAYSLYSGCCKNNEHVSNGHSSWRTPFITRTISVKIKEENVKMSFGASHNGLTITVYCSIWFVYFNVCGSHAKMIWLISIFCAVFLLWIYFVWELRTLLVCFLDVFRNTKWHHLTLNLFYCIN